MLIFGKDESGVPPKTTLSGIIDENADFSRLSGDRNAELHISCRDVHRINSVGIKIWRDFFGKLRVENLLLRFHAISPALVGTMNYISDFISMKEVLSICAPYICGSCKSTHLKELTLAEAKSFLVAPISITCENCRGTMEFDEITEEYFSFLKK